MQNERHSRHNNKLLCAHRGNSDDFLQKIFAAVDKDNKVELEVNLPEQTITILSTGEKEKFDITPYKKTCLLNGYDDIDYLLSMKNEIEEFEKKKEIAQSFVASLQGGSEGFL